MASQNAGSGPLDVVIVYAFDSTTSTPAWKKVNGEVYWLVHEKLTRFAGSCLGYIYVMSTPNNYTCEMKLVDPAETEATGYKGSSLWRRAPCVKNMASGLYEAQKLITDRGQSNGIILFFSDGLINQGDFFGGVENFVSKFPVHTFTVGGDAYNNGLRTIAANSPGGTFNPLPVPDKAKQSSHFSQLLDSILAGTVNSGAELNFSNLYLYQTYGGPKPNQSTLVNSNGATGLGTLAVNNWAIYEGLGPNAILVAHAQGLHMIYAGDWHHTFSIVFENERFKGSTLQVMGNSVEGSEWAIVGGTGKFARATGVIYKNVQEKRSDGNVIGLTIHGYCPALKGSQSLPMATPKKLGPWGGYWSGTPKDITETPRHLESITIYNERNLPSIEFSYIDQTGRSRTSGVWGSTGMTKSTINLSPSEVLLEVSGTYTSDVLSSLKFVTNNATYGPYGTVSGTPFRAPVPAGSIVVGFFAVAGPDLGQIGVYIMENARL